MTTIPIDLSPVYEGVGYEASITARLRRMGVNSFPIPLITKYLRDIGAPRLKVRKIAKQIPGATPHERKMFCMAVNPTWRKRFVK